MESTTLARLDLVLTLGDDRIDVRYTLTPADLADGEVLAELPVTVAGVPAITIGDDELVATDDLGPLPLTATTTGNVRRWTVGRATAGTVEVRHPAPWRPIGAEALPGRPPLDLRREGEGVTGTGQVFLALPPLTRRWRMTLDWPGAASFKGVREGTTEELLDCQYMAGGDSERSGPVTTWWLTPPGLDVPGFTAKVARLQEIMAADFGGVEAPELEVYLRSNPYPGLGGAGFLSSFVVGLDPSSPDTAAQMDFHLAHELVHVWIRPEDSGHDAKHWFTDVAWLSEGAADYFASVLPFRHGLIDRRTFLDQVNVAARICFGNPYRDLSLRQVADAVGPFTDNRAQRMPYGRGMFYLADLGTRLTTVSIEELVRTTPLADWVEVVSAATGEDEAPRFETLVQQPGGWPRPDLWGPDFEYFEDEAPLVDPGFAFASFVTRRVVGLVPGGPADEAGFREGDPLGDLPGYEALLRGKPSRLKLRQAVKVPAWR